MRSQEASKQYNNPINLLDLPAELLMAVFSVCTYTDLLRLSLVCQLTKSLAYDNHLWFSFYKIRSQHVMFHHEVNYRNNYVSSSALRIAKEIIFLLQKPIYQPHAEIMKQIIENLENPNHTNIHWPKALVGAIQFIVDDLQYHPISFHIKQALTNIEKRLPEADPYLSRDEFAKFVQTLSDNFFNNIFGMNKATLIKKINDYASPQLINEYNKPVYD